MGQAGAGVKLAGCVRVLYYYFQTLLELAS
jgi:hypothetical protein